MKRFCLIGLGSLLSWTAACAEEVEVLAVAPGIHVCHPEERAIPGEMPAHTLAFRHLDAEHVFIRHSGDHWSESRALQPGEDGIWTIAVADLDMSPGAHAFKFLIDGEWEEGLNRLLYLNEEGVMVSPPALYLTWRRDPTTTMTVHWHTDRMEDPSVVRYRPAGETEWSFTRGTRAPFPYTARWVHTVELADLLPDTRYEFQRVGSTRMYQFQTMPEQLVDPLRFVAGGDIYHRKVWMDAMNRRVASLEPAFVVIGGDLAYADGAPDNAWRWINYFASFYDHLISSEGLIIPKVVGIGNHEVRGGYVYVHDDYEPTNEWRERVAPYFFRFYAFPGHPGYGVLDFGDYLSLLMLDTMHVNHMDREQLTWLSERLDERADVPHLFPVYHVPAYPAHRPFDSTPTLDVRTLWIPLFEETGIRLAFENHDHVFKVTHPILNGEVHPDGIVYVGDGAWGVEPRGIHDPDETWYLRVAAPEFHVFEVVLEPNQRTVRAISADGRVLDEFTQPVD